MGLRFRQSVKIAPGLKLNIGKKSVGLSAGVRGAHVSTNTAGRKTASMGIPGTGVSYVKTISKSSKSTNQRNVDFTSYDSTDTTVSPKSRLVALLLCLFLGCIGVHRFYVGKVGTGIIWIITLGFCGIGVIIDLILIIVGAFKDKQGGLISNWNN